MLNILQFVYIGFSGECE